MPGGSDGSGYGFDASAYRQWSRPQREWGGRLLASLDLRGDERILDIGCGDGALTVELARAVPRGSVLGIDASSNMISLASSSAGGNLAFQVMDVLCLGFEREFDLAFSNAALHWVTDHHEMLSRVRRALRPGGRLRFNFAGEGNCANLFRVARELMAAPEFRRFFIGFSWPWYMPRPEEHASLLEETGFREVQVQGQVADRCFTTEELVHWIEHPSIVPLLEQVDDPRARTAFRDRVVARMVAETRQPDGRHFETFRRVDSTARR